jgi:two-component system LytT family sensor kinase
MLTNTSWSDPVLINTIGHTAGLLAFGFILLLLIRDWRAYGVRQTKLPMVAAVLACAWNAGSLLVLGINQHNSFPIGLIITANFAILSFLPAVLLQVVLQGKDLQAQDKWIAAAGYGVSGVAATLHFSETRTSFVEPHQVALMVIAAGFGVLTLIAFLVKRLRRARGTPAEPSDLVLLAALFLFAASFPHFGYAHAGSPWTAEITWHHVGIPVALIIILQDYRFLLLDTFVRFLVNFGLAGFYLLAVLGGIEKLHLWEPVRRSSFFTALGLVALSLSLVVFADLRNRLQGWVSRHVFRRSNLDDSLRRIAGMAVSVTTEQELLERAAQQVAQHFRAEQFAILTEPVMNSRRGEKPSLRFEQQALSFEAGRGQFRAEAQIPLRFSSGDSRYLVGGARRGGRRYLSEDLEQMRRLGAAIVEQVERFRAEELKRLVSQAELRALQAQINPHFLFNAFNTLYGTIDRKSYEARRMVLNLAEIFRYLLQSERAVIQLEEELRIVEAYLEIEALRLGDRLETELLVSEEVKPATIPVLSIQPLVENAVKHGIAAQPGRGRICLKAEQTANGVLISVADTGAGFDQSKARSSNGAGRGLENVRRRLVLCYGPQADLNIESTEAGTTVTFLVPR